MDWLWGVRKRGVKEDFVVFMLCSRRKEIVFVKVEDLWKVLGKRWRAHVEHINFENSTRRPSRDVKKAFGYTSLESKC